MQGLQIVAHMRIKQRAAGRRALIVGEIFLHRLVDRRVVTWQADRHQQIEQQPARTEADEFLDESDALERPAATLQHFVDGSGNIGRAVDQRAVEIEDKCLVARLL